MSLTHHRSKEVGKKDYRTNIDCIRSVEKKLSQHDELSKRYEAIVKEQLDTGTTECVKPTGKSFLQVF